MPADQPLSRGARRLLVRLCRESGLSLEGLDAEAVGAAEELYDLGAITTPTADVLELASWARDWAKAEPDRPESERLESDLAGSANRHDCGDDSGRFDLDGVADPNAVDPSEAAAVAEAEAKRPARRGDHDRNSLPPPTHLLGDDRPWPLEYVTVVVIQGKVVVQGAGACPGCQGRKLGPLDFCLWCERWGLDRMLPKAQRGEDRKGPQREWQAPQRPGLAGGTGKASAG